MWADTAGKEASSKSSEIWKSKRNDGSASHGRETHIPPSPEDPSKVTARPTGVESDLPSFFFLLNPLFLFRRDLPPANPMAARGSTTAAPSPWSPSFSCQCHVDLRAALRLCCAGSISQGPSVCMCVRRPLCQRPLPPPLPSQDPGSDWGESEGVGCDGHG